MPCLCFGSPNSKKGSYSTNALLAAAKDGDVDAVVAALTAKPRRAYYTQSWGGGTVWHVAARHGRAGVLAGLVDVMQQIPEPQLKRQLGRLGSDRAAIIYQLLDDADGKGMTPLHFACVYGHAAVVSLLMKAKANPFVQDVLGRTPLHYAASLGRISCVRAMLEAWPGPQPHWRLAPPNTPSTPLVDAATPAGCTPLHYAVWADHKTTIQALLSYDARLDIATIHMETQWLQVGVGYTPLHLAAVRGNHDIVKLLLAGHVQGLAAGAEVMAATRGQWGARHTGDPRYLRTRRGMMAYHLALAGGHSGLAELLHPDIPYTFIFSNDDLQDGSVRSFGPPRLMVIAAGALQRKLLAELEAVQAAAAAHAAAAKEAAAAAAAAGQSPHQEVVVVVRAGAGEQQGITAHSSPPPAAAHHHQQQQQRVMPPTALQLAERFQQQQQEELAQEQQQQQQQQLGVTCHHASREDAATLQDQQQQQQRDLVHASAASVAQPGGEGGVKKAPGWKSPLPLPAPPAPPAAGMQAAVAAAAAPPAAAGKHEAAAARQAAPGEQSATTGGQVAAAALPTADGKHSAGAGGDAADASSLQQDAPPSSSSTIPGTPGAAAPGPVAVGATSSSSSFVLSPFAAAATQRRWSLGSWGQLSWRSSSSSSNVSASKANSSNSRATQEVTQAGDTERPDGAVAGGGGVGVSGGLPGEVGGLAAAGSGVGAGGEPGGTQQQSSAPPPPPTPAAGGEAQGRAPPLQDHCTSAATAAAAAAARPPPPAAAAAPAAARPPPPPAAASVAAVDRGPSHPSPPPPPAATRAPAASAAPGRQLQGRAASPPPPTHVVWGADEDPSMRSVTSDSRLMLSPRMLSMRSLRRTTLTWSASSNDLLARSSQPGGEGGGGLGRAGAGWGLQRSQSVGVTRRERRWRLRGPQPAAEAGGLEPLGALLSRRAAASGGEQEFKEVVRLLRLASGVSRQESDMLDAAPLSFTRPASACFHRSSTGGTSSCSPQGPATLQSARGRIPSATHLGAPPAGADSWQYQQQMLLPGQAPSPEGDISGGGLSGQRWGGGASNPLHHHPAPRRSESALHRISSHGSSSALDSSTGAGSRNSSSRGVVGEPGRDPSSNGCAAAPVLPTQISEEVCCQQQQQQQQHGGPSPAAAPIAAAVTATTAVAAAAGGREASELEVVQELAAQLDLQGPGGSTAAGGCTLQQQLEESAGDSDGDEEGICEVCFDAPGQVALQHCGHTLCTSCSAAMCKLHHFKPALCPFCRQIICGMTLAVAAPQQPQ